MRRVQLLLVTLPLCLLHAAEPWQVNIPECVRPAILKLARERASEDVDVQTIRERLGLPEELSDPTATPEEVAREAAAAAQEAEDDDGPADPVEALRQEAEERFGVYEVGDEVEVTLLRRGTRRGVVERIIPGRVQISGRWVLMRDITEEDRIRFDAEESRRRIERYVRAKSRLLEDRPQTPRAEPDAAAEVYRRHGYVKIGNRWLPQADALEAALARARQARMRSALQETVMTVMTACGYGLTTRGWGGNGRPGTAVRFLLAEVPAARAGFSDEGYILDWQWVGPYNSETWEDHGFGTLYPPENDERFALVWNTITEPPLDRRQPVIDLGQVIGPREDVCAYLRTHIWAPDSRPLQLHVGSDDGVRVWLNGANVHGHKQHRPLRRDQDSVDIQTWRGWNELLVKVTQFTRDWAACVRILEPDGDVPDYLGVHAAPPARPDATGTALDMTAGFLTVWQLSGPYGVANASMEDLLRFRFPPEIGHTVRCRPVTATPFHNGNARRIDLSQILPGDDRAAYLATRVWAPVGCRADLAIGSDDSVRIWQNGQPIFSLKIGRGVVPDDDVIPVNLRAGWNEFLVKVVNSVGNWGFCARITNLETGAIADLFGDATRFHAVEITPPDAW